MTAKDMDSSELFKDTIAVFPDVDRGEASLKSPLTCMPYRCIVPKTVDNMLIGCRAFSSDDVTNNIFNLIPHCIALGEAAGTAAAIAIQDQTSVRKVDISKLQEQLKKQNVLLPD
jgi:hypothetical protein